MPTFGDPYPTLSIRGDECPTLDGVPIKAQRMEITMDGMEQTEVVITRRVNIEKMDLKHVQALIDTDTARMLVKLGWTPPPGQEGVYDE